MKPITPGSTEWHARLNDLLAAEAERPRGPATAWRRVDELGLVPPDVPVETLTFVLPDDEVAVRIEQLRAAENRVLSKAELEDVFGGVERIVNDEPQGRVQ